MKVYVANTTPNAVDLYYRLPLEETGKPLSPELSYERQIPPSSQIALANGREFEPWEVKTIFEHQQRHFGARWGVERSRGFVGLIFSDRPIDLSRFSEAIEQNREAAEDRSDVMLNATAAARLRFENERAQETGRPAPQRFELEISASSSPDIDVAGKGAEAVQPGVAPRSRLRAV